LGNAQTWTGENTLSGAVVISGILTTAGRKRAVRIVTTNYPATVNDDIIVCNSTTAITITLPAASGSGQPIEVKNVNIGLVTVAPTGADTIDGGSSAILARWDDLNFCDYVSGAWMIGGG
jgi:hypothetical protein